MTPYSLSRHLKIPVFVNKAEQQRHALLDCGSMGNFIHERLVEQLGLTRTPRAPIELLDVKGIKIGQLIHQVTVPLRIGAHEEQIVLDVAPIGTHALILGLPWLQFHNPAIDWEHTRIQFNSVHCNSHCLPKPHDVFAKQDPIESMEPDLVDIFAIDYMPTATEEVLRSMIPKEYHDFLDVFNPETPMSCLPPLRPQYDFSIELDPTKSLPKPARPYHMNAEEREDWQKWRDMMLRAGLITRAPANTPVAAPLFFVRKKDGTRCPVIDYRKLNDITIKDSFPLPRIDEMLERMQGAKVFSKFDLKMGYNIIS